MKPPSLPALDATARDLLLILFKRKWSIVLIVLVTVVSALAYLFVVQEPIYTAQAKILVKLGPEQAPPPTMLTSAPQATSYRFQEVNTEAEIMQSVDLLDRLITDFKLDDPPPPKPIPASGLSRYKALAKKYVNDVKELVDELMIRYGLKERMSRRQTLIYALSRALVVRGQKDSNILIAELTMPYKGETAVLLNRLVELYLERRKMVYKAMGVDYFREKEKQTGQELAAAEQQLEKFEMIGSVSMLGKQQEQLIQQIATAETALREAQVAHEAAEMKIRRLEEELAKPEPNFGRVGEFPVDSFPQGLLRQMAELARERERLRMTELDSGEKIKNNRSQFQALSNMLAANLRAAESERRAALETRRAAHVALTQQLGATKNRQTEVEALTRRARESEEVHLFYRRKLEETAATQASEKQRTGNVSIVQLATEPIVPAGMRKSYMLAIAAVASLFLALLWITIAEFFDDRVYTVEDVRRRLPGAPVTAVARAWPFTGPYAIARRAWKEQDEPALGG